MADELKPPRIVRAVGDALFDDQGREYVDLFSANGVAWLGHGRPAIVEAVARQLSAVWTTGSLGTPAREAASTAIDAWFGNGYRTAGLLSTGMEAAEFALRIARVVTSRPGAVGLAGNMHGKSLATSSLGWDNPGAAAIADFARVEFPLPGAERATLDALTQRLKTGRVGSVWIEFWQASAGAQTASQDFFAEVQSLAHAAGALLVVDELLTGFYRTGPRFCFQSLGLKPDLALVGKALGNGFPVAAVVARPGITITPAMLPGSTFAGNSLAAAAVTATLAEMNTLDLPALAAGIERIVRQELAPLAGSAWQLRGSGALWVLEGPDAATALRAAASIYARGAAVGCSGRWLRLLPAAVIDPQRLAAACQAVAEEALAASESPRSQAASPHASARG